MEDMFIAYRGNMASDSIILVSNGNIMIGQYNDGQILVNGIPYSVPADASNYYSAYGIKLERNPSDIIIYETGIFCRLTCHRNCGSRINHIKRSCARGLRCSKIFRHNT